MYVFNVANGKWEMGTMGNDEKDVKVYAGAGYGHYRSLAAALC